jgi:hypothetical protein
MTGISNSAKQGELDHFCDSVRHFANSVCGLTENSAQVTDTLCLQATIYMLLQIDYLEKVQQMILNLTITS